ncbi:hypothetical protein [Streptomyces sp. NPDC059256]|uniref:hypothetical protein n=1 Tax=Streptomyces sp. NPDC059256 TaxID=3346794 RepID=UPI0036AD1795
MQTVCGCGCGCGCDEATGGCACDEATDGCACDEAHRCRERGKVLHDGKLNA